LGQRAFLYNWLYLIATSIGKESDANKCFLAARNISIKGKIEERDLREGEGVGGRWEV